MTINIDVKMEQQLKAATCTLSITDKQGTLNEAGVLNTLNVVSESGKPFKVSGQVDFSTFVVYDVQPSGQLNG